ncbi:MAG TPA: HAD-IA family hydrolase [Microbacteriaceae bacterium]|nr:HAD-IA family hydrolase [Microbacteriaceae bacterium]
MSRFDTAALLFDMDGTLIDSTGAVVIAWTRLCERYGLDPEALLAVAHGVPARATIAKFLPEREWDAAFAWIEEAESTLLDGVVAIPGAAELVRQLNAGSAPWAVVTSATPRLAHARLGAAGIELPDRLITADMVTHGKPSPDAYLLAAEQLGVEARDCIVVEDAPAGIRAGLAAGATVVVRGPHGGDEAHGLLEIADFAETVLDGTGPRVRGRWR